MRDLPSNYDTSVGRDA